MTFKVKDMLFGKIAILLCLCLVMNNTFMLKSYADESIAAQNPLFIPINTFVTAALIGSGMIAKNSQQALDAGGQLVNDIISQIKSSEVAKSEANPAYDSPFRVINGGKSEKPNNDNKNGKWFAAAAGALAAHEIYASKDAVIDIMSKAHNLGGYDTSFTQTGIVPSTDLLSQSSASNIALQLAKISNSAVTQFDSFLHSSYWDNKDYSYNDCIFWVSTDLSYIVSDNPQYPRLFVTYIVKDDNISNLNLLINPFAFGTYSNSYGSSTNYYVKKYGYAFQTLNKDNVAYNPKYFFIDIKERNANQNLSFSSLEGNSNSKFFVSGYDLDRYSYLTGSRYAYSGYKWTAQNPIQFTKNVYNVNMSFDENFQNWLQGQIQGLGDQVIDAVRLGITSVNPSWNPNQEQIQEGTTPSNVIYQFINNYENPENIPDDDSQPSPGPDPDPSPAPAPEPVPDNEYLGSFLLPESITTKFPFCIPFDVVRCLRLFSTSEREAPRWECDIGYGSSKYHVDIDLSMFNDIASFIRPLEYIVFLVGLAIGTRSLIRG